MRHGNLRPVPALLVAAAALAALGALSRVPYTEPGADAAVIRLSWRLPGVSVRECRRPTEEELARLPAHMRRPEICERRVAPYRLRVSLNGEEIEDAEVRAAGAREDRPLYVFRELRAAPGRHRLEVEFHPEGEDAEVSGTDDGTDDGADDGMDDKTGEGTDDDTDDGAADSVAEAGAAIRLELDRELRLEPGRIALVTYDPDRHALAVR